MIIYDFALKLLVGDEGWRKILEKSKQLGKCDSVLKLNFSDEVKVFVECYVWTEPTGRSSRYTINMYTVSSRDAVLISKCWSFKAVRVLIISSTQPNMGKRKTLITSVHYIPG